MASGRHDDDVVQREEETHGPISRPALPRIADRGAASRVDAWFAIAAVFSSMPTVLAVFSATNLVYQIVRKPTEMLFPVSGTMNKMPAEREPLSVASAFCERLIINLLRLWRIQMESALAHAVPGTEVIVEVCVWRRRHCRSGPPTGTVAIRTPAANPAATATMITAITSNAS